MDMNNPNQHIKEYLDFYCDLNEPKFAVMLDGEWGSGKTWFIQDYIKNCQQKKQFLYISLNGKAQTSQIDENIFELLHPLLSSKAAKLTGHILRSAVKLGFKVDLNKDETNDAEILIPKINIKDFIEDDSIKKTLIFDDLERCSINIEELMGYINHFIEHLGLKVIIVGNTNEIPKEKEQDSKYLKIKEKLIGKTFTVKTNHKEAIDNFMNDQNIQKFKDIYKKNKDLIEGIFEQSEYKNLRLIRYCLIDFERIFNKIDDKYFQNKDFIKELLRCFLAITIEHSKKTLKNCSKNLPDNLYERGDDELNSISKEYEDFDKIFDKYKLNYELNIEKLWKDYIKLDHIDLKAAQGAFENTNFFATEKTPSWIELWYYHHVTDKKFNEHIKNLLNELNNKKYTKIEEILHIFGLLIFFIKKEINIFANNKALTLGCIKNYFENYVKELSDNNTLEITDRIDYEQKYGLGYSASDSDEFKKFKDYIKKIKNQKKDENLQNEAKKLTAKNIEEFMNKVSNPRTSNGYFNIPIMNEIDIDKLIKILNNLIDEENKSFNSYSLRIFFQNIKDRYEYRRKQIDTKVTEENITTTILKQESKFLKELLNLTKKAAKEREGKLSSMYWNEGAEIIKKIETENLKIEAEK